MTLRTLVVDDDPYVLQTLEHLLEFDGYEVITATNGADALDVARRELPDLILLDVMMPVKSGIEVAQELRLDAQLASTPIIMLTACASDVEVWNGWQSGIDSYITKPLDIFNLLGEIERVRISGRVEVAA